MDAFMLIFHLEKDRHIQEDSFGSLCEDFPRAYLNEMLKFLQHVVYH